jgi:hypothetical protein
MQLALLRHWTHPSCESQSGVPPPHGPQFVPPPVDELLVVPVPVVVPVVVPVAVPVVVPVAVPVAVPVVVLVTPVPVVVAPVVAAAPPVPVEAVPVDVVDTLVPHARNSPADASAPAPTMT